MVSFNQGSDPRVCLFAKLPISYRQALSKYTPVRCCVVSTVTPTLNNHHITGGFDIIRIVTKDNHYSVGHLIISIRVSRKRFCTIIGNRLNLSSRHPTLLLSALFIYRRDFYSSLRGLATISIIHIRLAYLTPCICRSV